MILKSATEGQSSRSLTNERNLCTAGAEASCLPGTATTEIPNNISEADDYYQMSIYK
jgi:hypothetical protein